MHAKIHLLRNPDGTYDLCIHYPRYDVEFARDFDPDRPDFSNRRLVQWARRQSKNGKIKTIKLFVSGILIASVAVASLGGTAAAQRYSMAYLYGGSESQQLQSVKQAADSLNTVSPSCFDLYPDGSLKFNSLSSSMITSLHQQGIKIVPFLSNHWDRSSGINALKNPEKLASAIAAQVEKYQLDGVNVDLENITSDYRDSYTTLVRLLRQKIPKHKEVSVAVAANPNNWQTGWHGSYDYAALSRYADHLFLMAYDEHYQGGESGPVASLDFVERSIQYALTKTSPDKIVVGLPFYGRVWSLDNSQVAGQGVSTKTIQNILRNCPSSITYDTKAQAVKAEFTVPASGVPNTVGNGTQLKPGRYVVWYENDTSYQKKLSLIGKYNLKGAGSWSLGQEDPSIWQHYDGWLNDAPKEASITLDTRTYSGLPGKTYRFLARVSGGTGSIPTAVSSNPNVVTVRYATKDSRGYLYDIQLVGTGNATITTSVDGKTASFPVTVTQAASPTLRLDTHSYTNTVGKKYRFLARVSGGTGSIPTAVSSNPNVVTVRYATKDSRGYLYDIQLVGTGNATITTSVDGKTASFPVTVTQAASPTLRLDTHSYTNTVGKKYRFLARVSGGTGSIPTAVSSNPNVVTVRYATKDSRGYLYDIQLVGVGNATITASVDGKSASFPVTVTR